MATPDFLSLSEALEIHANQIELYGGSLGVREMGLLEAAIAQPQATFGDEFLHKDIYEMASAYLYHLVQNHPSFDGNKRVGLAAAIVFLEMNGVILNEELEEIDSQTGKTHLYLFVLRVASGEMKKPEITGFLKHNSKKEKSEPL